MNTDRLKALRNEITHAGLAGYLVPRADEYQGEFVAPYAERLHWLTGFTGSGGCALVLADKAFMLTDGRYTLQAARQTDPSLYQIGDYIKTPIGKWITDNASEGDVIGYDPRLFTPAQINKIEGETKGQGITLKPIKGNIIDAIWQDQPNPPAAAATLFPDEIAGATAFQKRQKVAEILKEQGASACLLALPDSIAWLLNIRGSDIDYIPSVQSTILIDAKGRVSWFINPQKIGKEIRAALGNDVQIIAPDDMGVQIMALAQASDLPVLIDERYTPLHYKTLLETRGAIIKNAADPVIALKAQKTQAEQKSIRNAHILDGIALVKFLHWLEQNAVQETEISASEKLNSFRAENPAYKGESFPAISGFGPNGAIIHYRADETSNTALEEGSFLLLDSGGQYAAGEIYGTTDITRTIAIGTPTDEMRDSYTRVLKGHIALAAAKFPVGTVGAQIDTLARKPLWDVGLDYAHGTGHGVGCYLQVHEDAASISGRGQTAFQPGMLISNEPGYYKEGAYGIRIENLILVTHDESTHFMGFETISLAPFDKTPIITDMLTHEEKDWLNAYHAQVLETLAPHLDDDESQWLKNACSAID